MRLLFLGLALAAALGLAPVAAAWSWPVGGPVLRPYSLGPDAYAAGQHRGVDVAGAGGEQVRAPASGTVSFVGVVPSSGRTVTIQLEGYAVSLTHLGETSVAKGAVVAEGDPVGVAGTSGEPEWSTPYVHLGIRVSAAADGYVDPLSLLPPRAVVPPPPAAPAVAPAAVTAPATESAADPPALQLPGAEQAPGAVQSPGVIRSPGAVQKPGTVQSPGADQKPGAAQSPGPIQSPVAIQSPGAIQNSGAVRSAGPVPELPATSTDGSPGTVMQPAVQSVAASDPTGTARGPLDPPERTASPVGGSEPGSGAAKRPGTAETRGASDRSYVTATVTRAADAGAGVHVSESAIRTGRDRAFAPRIAPPAAGRLVPAGAAESREPRGVATAEVATSGLPSGPVAGDAGPETDVRFGDRAAGRTAARNAHRLAVPLPGARTADDPPSPVEQVLRPISQMRRAWVAALLLLLLALGVGVGSWPAPVESTVMERYYVTTPIYYVNSTPHIGHAYTTIAADILARNRRQRGDETFFLTGVDEHAAKVARVAAEQGLSPQEYADQIAVVWRELPERLNASNDFFIRTSDEEHKRFVQGFLQKLYDNGHVYQDVYAGLYCVGCEAFKTEADLVDGKCPEHDRAPEWIEERNWFFRLSSFQQQLLDLYERADFVQPAFRANEARSFIEGGLQDFSISRAGQTWGIPIPWDPDSVAYVWADALVNYLSALTYARPGEDLIETLWPAVRHLLAKDILRFHCVFWPAMLLGAGYEPPRQLFVHGYLLLDDRKISKSLGNVVDPLDLIDVYGADPVRFWCARAINFGQDGAASIVGIHERYERELGNDLGNLLSRTTAMVARYRDGTLRAARSPDGVVAGALAPLADDVAERLDRFDVTGALERIWEVVRILNREVETTAPWQLAKDPARGVDLDRVLYDLVDGLRAVAVALSAYIPDTAAAVLAALRQPPSIDWSLVAYGLTADTDGIEAAAPLFPRLEAPVE